MAKLLSQSLVTHTFLPFLKTQTIGLNPAVDPQGTALACCITDYGATTRSLNTDRSEQAGRSRLNIVPIHFDF